MKRLALERRWQRAAVFGLAYWGLGVGSAMLSNDLESRLVQATVRVGILLLALAVFHRHLRLELARSAENLRASAWIASGAVACGTFLLAVWAVGMAWRETGRLPAALLPALPIWPVATGLPAFVAALVGGSVMLRLRRRSRGR